LRRVRQREGRNKFAEFASGHLARLAKQPEAGDLALKNALRPAFLAHSCRRIHEDAAHHPQVAEHEQSLELRVFLSSSVANLHMAELLLITRTDVQPWRGCSP
jgi:hypothetical protein